MAKMSKKEVVVLAGVGLLGIVALIFDERAALFFKSIESAFLSDVFGVFRPFSAMIMLAGLMTAFLIIEHKRKWALPFAVTLGISTVISFIIKFIAMRPRPFGIVQNIIFTSIPDYSFPSSHVVFIFSALPILDKEFPKLKVFWLVLAGFIALSRVYFQAHYLSDVIFGGLIGYIIGYFVLRIEEKYISNRK
jgi:undecaprenyl-diphosphatase